MPDRQFWYSFFCFVVLLPGYGMLVALLRGGIGSSAFIDTSYIAAGLLFFTSLNYFCILDLEQTLANIVFILRAFGVLVIFAFIFFKLAIASDVLMFISDNDVARFGYRTCGEFRVPFIYFFASPMLLTLLAYDVNRLLEKRTIWHVFILIIPIAGLILSGTRANIILACGGVFIVCLWQVRYSVMARRLLWFGGLFFLFCVLVLGQELITGMVDPLEHGNSAKIAYLSTYLKIFSEPLNLLVGQGFNAHAWSDDFAGIRFGTASKTELTYLELLRVFGLPVSSFFFFILCWLITSLYKLPSQYQWLGPAIILNLLVSTLNPYLFSTNGMLLLGAASAVRVLRAPRRS